MPLADLDIVNLGINPVSTAAPAGEPVRYDPDFEKLSAEIAKRESLTSAAVDWSLVVELASSLLKTRTKDFRIAGYLVVGLFQTRGLEGLLSGLRMYEALARNFWETGYPEKSRLRGRAGAATWLQDRLASSLQARPRLSASDDLILELESAAEEFASRINESLRDYAPGFVDLLQAVSSRANEVRNRQKVAERARDESVRRTAGVESGEIADPADVGKVLDGCRERLWRLAGVLFRSDPANPISYRIRRGTSWGWLVELPTNENGTTYLSACPPEAVKRCESCAAAGNWLAIVQETESNFTERIFGFDLQRQALQAMSHLGETFLAARLAVLTELAGLLRRLPAILELRFVDGTPFADAETRAWIAAEVLQAATDAAPAGAKEAAGRRDEDGADLDAAISEARRLQDIGDLQGAVALFNEGIARAPKRRQRFVWRLELAKLCLDAGKPQLALPQLVTLDEDIGRFSLEEWEPDLSLEVIHQLFLCRRRLGAGLPERTSDVEHQLQELYQRLCRLDVNAALAVEY